jgi:hypothetical protein
VPKSFLVLAVALIAGTFLATTADARGGAGGANFYMMYVKPYKDAEAAKKKAAQSAQSDLYAKRRAQERRTSAQSEKRARAQAEAAAQARAAAKAREITAQRAAAAKANEAKADTAKATEAKANVAKAETQVPKTEDASQDAAPALAKGDLETPAATAVKSVSAPQTCRKYSAAIGGMVDAACE